MGDMYKQSRLKTIWARGRYFLAVAKANLLRETNPLLIVLIVNNRCNFRCKYCFGGYHGRREADYTLEEIKYIIDEVYRMGARYLNIHGGETLLRDDIGEIVSYIKSKGMYCCLITNGSLLDKKIDDVRNVDNLTISLDGCKENNDQVRGEGTFEKALRGIELAIQEKIPLRVSATLTRYTMGDVDYLANLAKELGFTLYYSILFKPLGEDVDFAMDDEEIRRAIKRIIELKRQGYPISTGLPALEYALDWPLDHNEYHFLKEHDLGKLPKGFKLIKCYYSIRKFIIEADGNVWPCFILSDKDVFHPLNWREVGLRRAIRHVQKTNTCKTCPGLSQNDHNLLLGLDPRQVGYLIWDQLKESFRRK